MLAQCLALRRAATVVSLCALTVPAFAQISVLTQRYNNARTGANLTETTLTTSSVNVNQFGLLFRRTVDDQVYTQPLYYAQLNIGGGTHNTVFVATVNNSVYAFDADDSTRSTPFWSVNLGTAPTAGGAGLCTGDIKGKMGIIGTPVIDGASKTLYVVALTLENTVYIQRLHALDITTGAEKFGGPVQITAPNFDALRQNQRPALLLLNGVVYIAWGSHCDTNTYHAFLMGYNATTLAQVTVQNLTPGGNGSIWMAGGGPAADGFGNVYVMTGNGAWDGTANFGESFVKLSTNAQGVLSVADWFTPSNWSSMNSIDADLGSSGPLLIPNTSLIVGGGKPGKLYLLNTNNLGHETTNDTGAVQIFQAVNIGTCTYNLHCTPTYWSSDTNGPMIYTWGENDVGRCFKFNGTTFNTTAFAATTMTSPATGCGMPGAQSVLSANNGAAGSGILWVNAFLSGNANGQTVPGVLRAFNADNINQELWDSQMNAARDSSNNYAKFNYPVVVNGKVYQPSFGTQTTGSGELDVYGLLNGSQTPITQEAENLAATGSGQAITTNPDVNASGGAWILLNSTGATQYIQFTTASIPAGTYQLKLGYKSNTGRGQHTVAVDGNVVGGTIDQYAATASFLSTTVANVTFGTTGTHTITLTVTGKNAASTGYQLSADYFMFVPVVTATTLEAESMTATSNGPVITNNNDSAASGGVWVLLAGTGTGQYLQFTTPSLASGTYQIQFRYKTNTQRAQHNVVIDATQVGGTVDQYSTTIGYTTVTLGNVTLSAGTHTITLNITGHNAASTGYYVSADSFILTPQ